MPEARAVKTRGVSSKQFPVSYNILLSSSKKRAAYNDNKICARETAGRNSGDLHSFRHVCLTSERGKDALEMTAVKR